MIASAFPKIFTIGQRYTENLFNGVVEITEKVDGSQFCWGRLDGELFMRSKGKQLFVENPEKMFKEAIEYIKSIEDAIDDGWVFYGEYLQKPKHNCLTYNRTPKNHIALFGACEYKKQEYISKYKYLKGFADMFEIDVVPLLFDGTVYNDAFINEFLTNLLETKSYLGNCNIEGFVVKNYGKDMLLGGQIIPLLSGKFVSEKFKEVQNTDWKKNHIGKGKFELLKESYKTEARWEKAIQHLRELEVITDTPKDIGIILKEIQTDIIEEEKENIKESLYNIYYQEILRAAVSGFPQWYKEKLFKENIGI